MSTTTTDTTGLTAGQIQQLANLCKCFKTKPEIDVKKLAALGGYSNEASARAVANKILRILMGAENAAAEGGAEGEVEVSPVKKKATPRKRKGTAPAGSDEEVPKRKRGRAVQEAGEDVAEAEEGGDDVAVKGEGDGEDGKEA